MPKEEEKGKGLYNKYNVTKADGSVIDAPCVVLKMTDPLATKALVRWAVDMGVAGYLQVEADTLKKLNELGMLDEKETDESDTDKG